MDEVGLHYRDFGGVSGQLIYSSSYEFSFQLLSGDPPDSSGLTVDRIWAQVALVPEPSTWAMMIVGFAVIGFVSYRKSRVRAIHSLPKRQGKSEQEFRHGIRR
jgi:hypothetical protein